MTKRRLLACFSLSLATAIGCGASGGDEMISCGGGAGYRVAFCAQVPHYEAGYGVQGVDEINVDCIAGPSGAGVYESPNGTYYVAGTYKLGSFATASVELNWGGSTSYSSYVDYEIAAPGDGAFSVSVTKTDGGEGNMFLSMLSGSMWMFDLVPVDDGCGTAFESRPLSSASTPEARRPWRYGPLGEPQLAGAN